MWAAWTIDSPVALISAVLGLGALLGAAYGVFRSRASGQTVDTLEQALRIERTERQVENERCRKDIEKLQAQVAVLENGLGQDLAEAVLRHLRDRGVIQ